LVRKFKFILRLYKAAVPSLFKTFIRGTSVHSR